MTWSARGWGGQASVALVIPPDFSRRLGQGLTASVQLVLDGSSSTWALVARGHATRIVRGYSRGLEIERVRAAVGDPGPVPTLRNWLRAWYNPALRSVPFELPGRLRHVLRHHHAGISILLVSHYQHPARRPGVPWNVETSIRGARSAGWQS